MTTSTVSARTSSQRDSALLLACRGIEKRYGAVQALKDVDFDLRAGEVHALLGQNGAGKSTLIKVLAGAVQRDDGVVEINGVQTDFRSPSASRSAGISIVYQELSLVPTMTVAANLFLGREPRTWWGNVDRRRIRHEAARLLEEHNVPVDPRARVESLPFAHRQLVEIAGALKGDVRILVLDEPTSALTGNEESVLFEAVNRVVSQGVGVIYVTHRMSEVFRLADRVTVLRDGANVSTQATKDTDLKRLVSAIVGSQQQQLSEVATSGLGPHGERASSPQAVSLSQDDVARLRDANLNLAVLLHTSGEWSELQVRGIRDRAEHLGVDVIDVLDVSFDADQQAAAVERLLGLAPDLVIGFPVDRDTMGPAFARFGQAGIPLVLMDQAPDGLVAGSDYASVVSTDNYVSGQEAGRLLADHVPEGGRVAICSYDREFFPTMQRQQGFMRWFREERDDVDQVVYGFAHPDDSAQMTRQFLAESPEVDGIFVVWDEPARGVTSVVEEFGLGISVVTIDLTEAGVGMLERDGPLVGVVAQRPYDLGRAEVDAAATAWLGRTPPPWIALPPRPVRPHEAAEAHAELTSGRPGTVEGAPTGSSEAVSAAKPSEPAATQGLGTPVMELNRVSNDRLREVSLSVGPGEILGLAGLLGSGRTELLETVFGLRPVAQGELLLAGRAVSLQGPADAIARGLALAPEDRHDQGLVLQHSIERNVAMPRLPHLGRMGFFLRGASRQRAEAAMAELSVKAPGPRTRLDQLSGGNQQKIVFGKWRDPDPVLLLLDEPTAGVDVGARDEIYGVIHRMARDGAAVLVASSEFAELLLLCDRIAIVADGTVTTSMPREEIRNEDHLNQLAQEAGQ